MRKKHIAIAVLSLLLHMLFVVSSYETGFASFVGKVVDPLFFERTLMLLQFLPLIIVVVDKELQTSRILLFFTFAICISTLFIVDDFNSGFYGAMIENTTGILPRIRASAHLMAYQDTGRLVFLDYHGEYFLEFIMVNFLSTIAGLDYTLTYFLLVRVLGIFLWSLLFVWFSNTTTGPGRRIWLLLFAASIMLANQSYNREFSFGPILLVFFYLITRKQQSRSSTIVAFSVVVAILLASFRETQLLSLMSTIALLLIILRRSGTSTNPRSFSTGAFFNILLLIFSFTRTFFLTSEGYAESYASYSFRLWGSVVKLFGGSIPFQEPVLTTAVGLQNPLDRGIASLSFVFAVGFLIFVAILSARFVVKRNFDPFSSAISLVFIITLAVPVSAYVVLKTQESGPLHDFGSATALARSMAPLVIIMMAPHFRNIGRINFPFKRLFLALVVIGLSLIVLFAPFIFLRGDVKSVYDMRQIAGDVSEFTILGNHVYEFVISHRPIEAKIRISSSATVSFLRLYEFLPLQYRTGGRVEIGYVNMTLESRTYDSGMFTVSISQTEQSTLFMNELEFAEH